MKKTFLIISALMMLMACGGKNAKTESTEGTETEATETAATDSTAVSAQEEVTGVINKLYAAAVKNEADIDSRFACHEWCEMVAAVNEKDSQEAEIGFFNDDYWTEMQDDNPDDLEARDIKFEKLDDKEGTALVDFTLYSSVQTVHMKFCFCRDDGKWRVHDIIRFYPDEDGKETSYSLMEAMREYLGE